MAPAATARGNGLLVLTANSVEAVVVERGATYPGGGLAGVLAFLRGQLDFEEMGLGVVFGQNSHVEEDFVDVKGQRYAVRGLLTAAPGGHNARMLWPLLNRSGSRSWMIGC